MTKILKFPKRIQPYSETFLTNVKPAAIGDFIKGQHPAMSVRSADAMHLALIYGCIRRKRSFNIYMGCT